MSRCVKCTAPTYKDTAGVRRCKRHGPQPQQGNVFIHPPARPEPRPCPAARPTTSPTLSA